MFHFTTCTQELHQPSTLYHRCCVLLGLASPSNPVAESNVYAVQAPEMQNLLSPLGTTLVTQGLYLVLV